MGSLDTRVPHVPSNDPERRQDLRTEYAALAGYFRTVVTFRFTVLGLFIAGVGFIVRGGVTVASACLILSTAVALWLVELRTRSLTFNLGERGVQIERDGWGYSTSGAYDPFFSHQFKGKFPAPSDPDGSEAPPPDKAKMLWFTPQFPFAHRHGLDLLYLGVVLYASLFVISYALAGAGDGWWGRVGHAIQMLYRSGGSG